MAATTVEPDSGTGIVGVDEIIDRLVKGAKGDIGCDDSDETVGCNGERSAEFAVAVPDIEV